MPRYSTTLITGPRTASAFPGQNGGVGFSDAGPLQQAQFAWHNGTWHNLPLLDWGGSSVQCINVMNVRCPNFSYCEWQGKYYEACVLILGMSDTMFAFIQVTKYLRTHGFKVISNIDDFIKFVMGLQAARQLFC